MIGKSRGGWRVRKERWVMM